MNLWTPSREWEGQDAFLIGGGPSLASFSFSTLAGQNTIGCNDAFHLGADIIKFCIFGDANWWHKNKWALEKFPGRFVTNCPALMHFEVPRLLKMKRERDGIHNENALGWNYSTGAMAINLAISLGAARIFLLGYDLTNKAGKSHWHKHNPNLIKDHTFNRFMKGFQMVQKCLPEGVKVYNVTDGTSQLECFPCITFEAFQSMREEVPA